MQISNNKGYDAYLRIVKTWIVSMHIQYKFQKTC